MNRTTVLFAAALAVGTFGGERTFAHSRALLALGPHPHAEARHTAVVERVLDGDTVVVRGLRERVRLANIDAPEMSHGYRKPGQPFSVQASRWLEAKVQGKTVSLRCPDQDRYGRQVCDLFVGHEYVNRELVRAGLAWANTARPEYLRDTSVLDAQREAREAHRGLWVDRHPTPPWRWRHACWQERTCTISGSPDGLSP